MAFTLEDGTGVANANAYIDETFADTFHGDRGNTTWTIANTADKQSAIIRATDYVDKRFGARFRGYKEHHDQGLEWPRISAFDNDDFLWDGVPAPLEKAVAEYALIALQISLLPLPARPYSTLDPATGSVTSGVSGQVVSKREKVGPLEEETRYSDVSKNAYRTKPAAASSPLVSDFNLPEYPVADEWLKELLKNGFAVELRRA